MLSPDNIDEGQSYEDHSEVYSHIARSLAPDAAMHAYARNTFSSGGTIDSIHTIEGRQIGTSDQARSREPLPANEERDDRIGILKPGGTIDAQVSDADSYLRPASNDQFAGLLEAVTTAAGQEAAQNHATKGASTSSLSSRPKRTTRQSRVIDDQVASDNTLKTIGKRKRTSAVAQSRPNNIEEYPVAEVGARKRMRIGEAFVGSDSDDNEAVQSAEAARPTDEEHSTLEIRELPPQLAMSDARAAGVHSAAALFRRPSASSKKYTRPPMSKLFTSLELSPENFLHLQAAAKSYMLNEAYPERQDCVGNRGKGDTDMVKLRLYNCVKEFLEVEGYGNKYFGKDVFNEGMGDRKFTWPAHKNKVIALVTPLLRRMVTNERQRQYAIETRKGPGGRSGANKKRKADEMETPPRDTEFQSRYDLGDIDIDPNLELEAPFVAIPTNGHNEDSGISQRLAELCTFSTLPRQEWDAIVGRVFDHVRNEHHEDRGDRHCEDGCHELFLIEETRKGLLSHGDWGFADGASDDEKYTYALLVMRDLFGVINSTVEEEKRAHVLQNSIPVQLPSTKSATFKMTLPFSDIASRAGIPPAAWATLVENTGVLFAHALSESYAAGSEEIPYNLDEVADAKFDELVIRQGLLQQGSWGSTAPSHADTKLLCARGVVRDLARAIVNDIVACQNGEHDHEEMGEEEDTCETRAPKRQKLPDTTSSTTDGTHQHPSLDTVDQPLKLHILYIDNGEPIRPPLNLDVAKCPDYLTLGRTIKKHIPEQHSKRFFSIQAHLFDGLHTVGHNQDFAEAVESAEQTKWMENELKLIVNMGEAWKDLGDTVD
ncbi:MAG: hypothetical protein M1812_000093 [Candelaria pacifica]|nr:MAG: hypothetical protein M1812_000093 [Candelaria pacifica]